MNGAESLVRTLVKGGVEVCFANPGTSEMHFVGALDRVEGMRCVLGLFEGVCSGAADGYYRMKDKPASTLLHLGPGLANAAANLHNAKKAGSGIGACGTSATGRPSPSIRLASNTSGSSTIRIGWSPEAKCSTTCRSFSPNTRSSEAPKAAMSWPASAHGDAGDGVCANSTRDRSIKVNYST